MSARTVGALVLFALAAYIFYSSFMMGGAGTVFDKLRGAVPFINQNQTANTAAQQPKDTMVMVRVLNALNNKPLEGLEVTCLDTVKYTDSAGKVVFTVGKGKQCTLKIDSGWSLTRIYPKTVTLNAAAQVHTVNVYPKGAFLPLNAVAVTNPELSSSNGVVRIPPGVNDGTWLINVGTSSYVASPCIALTGDTHILERVRIVRISGRMPEIEVEGDVKTALTSGCYEFGRGITADDTTIYRLYMSFNGPGTVKLELRDKACESCRVERIEFVKG